MLPKTKLLQEGFALLQEVAATEIVSKRELLLCSRDMLLQTAILKKSFALHWEGAATEVFI